MTKKTASPMSPTPTTPPICGQPRLVPPTHGSPDNGAYVLLLVSLGKMGTECLELVGSVLVSELVSPGAELQRRVLVRVAKPGGVARLRVEGRDNSWVMSSNGREALYDHLVVLPGEGESSTSYVPPLWPTKPAIAMYAAPSGISHQIWEPGLPRA